MDNLTGIEMSSCGRLSNLLCCQGAKAFCTDADLDDAVLGS